MSSKIQTLRNLRNQIVVVQLPFGWGFRWQEIFFNSTQRILSYMARLLKSAGPRKEIKAIDHWQCMPSGKSPATKSSWSTIRHYMHIKLSYCYSKVPAFFGPSTVIQNVIVKHIFKGKPRQKVNYLKLRSDSNRILLLGHHHRRPILEQSRKPRRKSLFTSFSENSSSLQVIVKSTSELESIIRVRLISAELVQKKHS